MNDHMSSTVLQAGKLKPRIESLAQGHRETGQQQESNQILQSSMFYTKLPPFHFNPKQYRINNNTPSVGIKVNKEALLLKGGIWGPSRKDKCMSI